MSPRSNTQPAAPASSKAAASPETAAPPEVTTLSEVSTQGAAATPHATASAAPAETLAGTSAETPAETIVSAPGAATGARLASKPSTDTEAPSTDTAAPHREARKRKTHPAVWLPLAVVPLAALIGIYYSALRSPRYEPAQPVPFNHDTHTAAPLAAMPCLACHPGAESGARAGMPSSASCMDCHRHILPDDPRLLPLHAAADPDSPVYHGEALRWVRVQALPGHVHFHHGAHARAGISCEECHARPGAAQDHSMSNCLDCHRREGASTDCSTCHH